MSTLLSITKWMKWVDDGLERTLQANTNVLVLGTPASDALLLLRIGVFVISREKG